MDQSLVNTPKTKRGEITLNKIIKSAEDNFLKHGYHTATISMITQQAGVALGTYYIYFEDKLSVYKYLLLQYSYQIRKHIAIAVSDLTDRKEIERLGFKTYLQFIKEKPHIYNIIWESLYIDKELFRNYYETFAKFYSKGIQQSQGEGFMREYDPELLSYILMGIATFVGLQWIVFKETDNFDSIVDDIINILDKGIFLP